MVWVPSRRQAQRTALDLITMTAASNLTLSGGNGTTGGGVTGSGGGTGSVGASSGSSVTAGGAGVITGSNCPGSNVGGRFLPISGHLEEALSKAADQISDRALAEVVRHGGGIAFLHEAINRTDRRLVEALFAAGALQTVIISHHLCWSAASTAQMTAYLVVVMDTQAGYLL
ncbi:unnamed protein product [Protopolystoma xenopodis]|uniref:Uncharacterized protein n=1 Tax=Protopolystoma xenopodis TaxID=117903 RepID=A0A3S5CI13_9PLAT|nr:unnamed protein product [Protopolystoma xenopodis]